MRGSLKYFILVAVMVLTMVGGAVFFRFKNNPDPTSLPPASTYNMAPALQAPNPMPSTSESSIVSQTPLPMEVNLKVPFISQAPHLNWDLPYKQFCEEASVLMTVSYLNGKNVLTPDEADKEMLNIRDFEIKKFGYYEDTTVEETAVILREYYNFEKFEIVSNPAIEDIKKSLAEGKVVIVPLAGQQIGNPYYQQPGPVYHMLVIKGYTKKGDFITHDPGTKRGADFLYPMDTIMQAIHDWDEKDIDAGKRVVLIVG